MDFNKKVPIEKLEALRKLKLPPDWEIHEMVYFRKKTDTPIEDPTINWWSPTEQFYAKLPRQGNIYPREIKMCREAIALLESISKIMTKNNE